MPWSMVMERVLGNELWNGYKFCEFVMMRKKIVCKCAKFGI